MYGQSKILAKKFAIIRSMPCNKKIASRFWLRTKIRVLHPYWQPWAYSYLTKLYFNTDDSWWYNLICMLLKRKAHWGHQLKSVQVSPRVKWLNTNAGLSYLQTYPATYVAMCSFFKPLMIQSSWLFSGSLTGWVLKPPERYKI